VCTGISSALSFDKVMVQLRDPEAGVHRCCAAIGWPAGDRALETPTTDADLARMLDPQFEINGCYLLSHEEGAARCSQASVGYKSQLNGAGPNAWNRHWLLLPLRARDDSIIGVIWVDDPTDRLLPQPRRLQALRLFANQATSALATATLRGGLRRDDGDGVERAA
jgi:hypothetical protein